MKKRLILFLALALLFTGVFAPLSRAEDTSLLSGMMSLGAMTSQLTEEQKTELETVMEYLATGLSEEDAPQVFSWDKDTILEKLEGYDKPLEHFSSKEEVAGFIYDYFSAIAPFFQMNEEEIASQTEGLFSALGGFSMTEAGTEGETAPVEYNYSINNMYNNTFWENGSRKMSCHCDKGVYTITITDGEQEQTYLCRENEEDGTLYTVASEEPDAAKDGKAAISYEYENGKESIILRLEDGTEEVFARIIDPLHETQWYANGLELEITWYGDNNYELAINGEVEGNYTAWKYQCTLDGDVLTGTGTKSDFMGELYTDASAAFTFGDDRTTLTWKDDKEPLALEGFSFDAVNGDLTRYGWGNDDYSFSCGFSMGLYHVTIYTADGETHYEYLCTYDKATGTLTAVNPDELDFEVVGNQFALEKDEVSGNATFTQPDDSHLLWKETTGITGEEGVLLAQVY